MVLGHGVPVWANYQCGKQQVKGVIIGEDHHDEDGHRWELKYYDGERAFLPDKYVKVRQTGEAAIASSLPPAVNSSTPAPAKGKTKRKETTANPRKVTKKLASKKKVPEPDHATDEDEDEEEEEEVLVQAVKKAPVVEKAIVDVEEEDEVKIIVPFVMADKGCVVVPVQVAWALSGDVTDEVGFQSKRRGDRGRAQQLALQQQVHVRLGFSIESPFYDILSRGHKMVYDDNVGRIHFLNQLNPNGIKYRVEYIAKTFMFANIREHTIQGKSEVFPLE